MKDAEDMSVIGPVIKEQQKILNDCTEKKISLVKLQSVLLKQSGGNNKEGYTKLEWTEDEKELFDKLMKDDNKNTGIKDGTYTIQNDGEPN